MFKTLRFALLVPAGMVAGPALAQAPQEVPTISIAAAVDEAIAHNLGLLALKGNLAIADAALLSARLRPNPVASASADHLDWLGTGFNEVNNGGPMEFAFRMDVPFERANKRDRRIELASLTKSVAEAQFANAVRQLQLDVTLACIDVQGARAMRALVADNLRALEEIARVNRLRVAAGAISPFESTRSDVAMLQFRSTAARAELELTTASVRLQTLLGRPPHEQIDVGDALRIDTAGALPELEHVKTLAVETRPDLRALQLGAVRSVADLRLQEANGKVDYMLGAEYRRQQGVSGRSNSLGFFMSAPLPLSNRNQGEIARAEAERQQVSRQIAALRAEVLADVQAAYSEYQATRALVGAMERDLLKPAASAREISTYTYRAGGSSLLELLDAQRAFNDTMQGYLDAQVSSRKAISRLNAAVGMEVMK
jgi:cobalt-zinc-cadmium efflux system outer membrane protein